MRATYLLFISILLVTSCAKKESPKPTEIKTNIQTNASLAQNDSYDFSQKSTYNDFLDLKLVAELAKFEKELQEGLSLEKQNKIPEAIKIYQKVGEEIPHNPVIKHRIMLKYSELKDWKKTDVVADELIKMLEPKGDNVSVGEKSLLMDAYTIKAVCSKYLFKDDRGLALADKSLNFAKNEYKKYSDNKKFTQSYHKNMMLAYNLKGDLYQRDEHFYFAQQAFNEAVNIAPNNAPLRLKRGVVNTRLKKYKDVIEDMSFIINQNPNFAFAYMMRASAYDSIGQKEKAQQDTLKFKELCTTCVKSLAKTPK